MVSSETTFANAVARAQRATSRTASETFGYVEYARPFAMPSTRLQLLAAAVKLTVVADENLTVGSTVRLPAESVAPGR